MLQCFKRFHSIELQWNDDYADLRHCIQWQSMDYRAWVKYWISQTIKLASVFFNASEKLLMGSCIWHPMCENEIDGFHRGIWFSIFAGLSFLWSVFNWAKATMSRNIIFYFLGHLHIKLFNNNWYFFDGEISWIKVLIVYIYSIQIVLFGGFYASLVCSRPLSSVFIYVELQFKQFNLLPTFVN